uniref:CWF21 domain-containing protein n=1 Tax=Hyaloperonospora arabidopsidis (strain Emoy2) TaxID=559515 RepID=M4B648_HYAAE
MYNGIGLRTVRGSGTNGYVQRNLSYVNASRTRQTLELNKGGGTLGEFGAHGGGKNRPPPNAEILLHEKKRRVELQLLELSLEMEERECDPEDIQDKVKRERERLLARLDGENRDRGAAEDVQSSHARQKRKEEENKRIKNAFGIASDYVAGESFDSERKEMRRQERKERSEQEWKEREEARKLRLKERKEKDIKMESRLERFRSGSRSRAAPCSQRSKSPADRRGRDGDTSRKSFSHLSVSGRRSRRSPALERKRFSVSPSRSRSSRSSGSKSSCSRSRSRKLRKETRRGKGNLAAVKVEHSPLDHARSSDSTSSVDSEPDRGRRRSHGERIKVVGVKTELVVNATLVQSAVLKGEHKVLNLSGHSTSIGAVAIDDLPVEADTKDVSKKSALSPAKPSSAKEATSVVVRQEEKRKACPEKRVAKARTDSTIGPHPDQATKEEDVKAPRSPRRSRVPQTDQPMQSRKRRQRTVSPHDRRRRGRSTSTSSSKTSRSPRRRRMRSRSQSRSHLVSPQRSWSHSSASSRSSSRSRSKSRFRRRGSPRGSSCTPSRSRSRSFGRSKPRRHR